MSLHQWRQFAPTQMAVHWADGMNGGCDEHAPEAAHAATDIGNEDMKPRARFEGFGTVSVPLAVLAVLAVAHLIAWVVRS